MPKFNLFVLIKMDFTEQTQLYNILCSLMYTIMGAMINDKAGDYKTNIKYSTN